MFALRFLETPERFLPVKPAAMLQRMLRDPRLSDAERGQLGALLEMIDARFHLEFRRELKRLKTLYDPFDPDRDTLPLAELTPAERRQQRAALSDAFARLLAQGNYVELSRDEIRQCLELQPYSRLMVRARLEECDELRVFYRGVHQEERTHPCCFAPWRRRGAKVHVFARAALLISTSQGDQDRILLKLFRNVVVGDLKMMLPGVRILMRWFDRIKIGSTVAGSLATAGWKAFTAAILSPVLFLIVLAGFAGAFVKGLFSFFNSKTRYMQALSSNLYFQNLANNTSALALLVDAAESEEAKELLLAYFLLYVERKRDYTPETLDERAQQWLREEFGLEADFEVQDAVRKLIEKGLVVQGERAILKVFDLPTALRRLDRVWDDYFAAGDIDVPAADRLADGDWPPYPADVKADEADAPPAGVITRIDAGSRSRGVAFPASSPLPLGAAPRQVAEATRRGSAY